MRKNNPLFSFVIPVFNESAGIGHFIEKFFEFARGNPLNFELVFVDDGSFDKSVQIIEEKSKTYPLKCIKLSRNFGKENAITAGLAHTRGDAVIILDADLQHPFELISEFIEKWHAGYDMVYGIRNASPNEGYFRKLFTKYFYKLFIWTSHLPLEAGAGDFRLMDRKIVDTINSMHESARFMKGLYSWVGFKKIGIPFESLNRHAGESTFNIVRLFNLARIGITSFTVAPLRISMYLGLLISIISSLYGLLVIVDTLVFGIDLPGWSTLVAGVFLLGGVQLLFIGILGEYIGHIFTEVKKRPNFIVDRIIESNKKEKNKNDH